MTKKGKLTVYLITLMGFLALCVWLYHVWWGIAAVFIALWLLTQAEKILKLELPTRFRLIFAAVFLLFSFAKEYKARTRDLSLSQRLTTSEVRSDSLSKKLQETIESVEPTRLIYDSSGIDTLANNQHNVLLYFSSSKPESLIGTTEFQVQIPYATAVRILKVRPRSVGMWTPVYFGSSRKLGVDFDCRQSASLSITLSGSARVKVTGSHLDTALYTEVP